MKRTYYYLFAIILSLLLVVQAGCGRRSKKEDAAFPVEVAKVIKGEIFVKLFYVGDIKAQEQVKVYPKVTGKLIENLVEEQDRVKKGDIIAYIDRDEIGYEFEKAPVDSPINGIVGNIYLDKGENVSPNVAVAQIVNMAIVKVRINIVERDLPKIKEGQLVEAIIDAYPNEVFKGVVERVSPVVDTASRTALIEISIPNEDYRLKPGMFARVWIVVENIKDALIIPRDAVIKEDSLRFAFIVMDNKAVKKRLELGISENSSFRVISGVEEGDYIVTLGNVRLKDGDIVKITNEGKIE